MKLAFPAAAAALLFSVSAAQAQITTVVTPPRERVVEAVPTPEDTVRQRDEAQRRITGMQEWVDSVAAAAGLERTSPTVPATTATPDSPAAGRSVAQPATPRAVARATPEFRDGAPAPDTATPLPLLALLGGASLLAGLALRRRR